MIDFPLYRSLKSLVAVAFLATVVSMGACNKTTPTPPVKSGGSEPPPHRQTSVTWGRLAGHRIQLEIADTADLRADGLAGRKSLDTDCGMIFVYGDAEERAYWMKGCVMGLDIAFLDGSAQLIVVYSVDPPRSESEEHETYSSGGKARYVVEMKKGWFSEHRIQRGEKLLFSPLLQRRADALARSEAKRQ